MSDNRAWIGQGIFDVREVPTGDLSGIFNFSVDSLPELKIPSDFKEVSTVKELHIAVEKWKSDGLHPHLRYSPSTCVWFWGESDCPVIKEEDYLGFIRKIEKKAFFPIYVFAQDVVETKSSTRAKLSPEETAMWYVNRDECGPVYCVWNEKKWHVADSIAEFLARIEQDYAISDTKELSIETERLHWLKGKYGWATHRLLPDNEKYQQMIDNNVMAKLSKEAAEGDAFAAWALTRRVKQKTSKAKRKNQSKQRKAKKRTGVAVWKTCGTLTVL